MTTTTEETMTDLIRALATPVPTGEMEPCGCLMLPGYHFVPCAACKAEVNADLAEVYGAVPELVVAS
jgi:hypothetical protein